MNPYGLVIASLTTTQLYIILGVAVLATFLLGLYFRYCTNRVNESSQMLRDLHMLNQSYHFHKGIKKTERLTKPCNSKPQFDRINLENFFKAVMEENIEYYDNLLAKIEANKMLYAEYREEYCAIKTTADRSVVKKFLIPFFLYKIIESFQFKQHQLVPRMDTSFVIRTTYISPKGKNAYQKACTYSLMETRRVLEEVHLSIERKKTKEYQRAMMSDALRYEIMHRDGFRCQLCGVSAKDGAMLHVDHIVPVSKGGKTEKNNLRTLCDRCNLGKRNRIE